MGVEVRPLNVLCNIQCQYCYQNPQRDADNIKHSYDLDKIKTAIKEEGRPFTLFGGEPLLLPLADLENLWAWGYERFGRNSIQTNGTLISEDHIRLFHKYKVHIGISMDGPEELNDVRWHGNLERTRQSTAKSQHSIEKLCQEGLNPSLIVTLHRANANSQRLPKLLQWVRDLHRVGVPSFRLHLLESENAAIRATYGLSPEENIAVLTRFFELTREVPSLYIDLFAEMRNLLLAEDHRVSCIWNACDPYTTRAVRGIEGQGQKSNCGRTNKDGIDFVKSDSAGFERYLALYHTPQEAFGCKDCRFFLMCKGQCPGTAVEGDWRNRSEHCEVWMAIFELLEEQLKAEGKMPLSLSPKRQQLELQALEQWSRAKHVRIVHLPELQPAASLPA
jgi:radical SAM protein with 4Fe4S-binding SPASM domain